MKILRRLKVRALVCANLPRERAGVPDLKDENSALRLDLMTTGLSGTNNAAPTDARLTDKEFVMDLLHRLPDEMTIYDIIQKLEFVAAVRQGLAAFDENKDSISIEQVEPQLTSWSVTVGRKRRGRQQRNASKSPPKANSTKRKAGDSLKSPALQAKA